MTTLGFAEETLKLPLYKWQAAALFPLQYATGPNAQLINIAVAGPNGIGKDDRLIPCAAYWWLAMHKRGKVVITSKSDTQLTDQTIVSLDKHWPKFGWNKPTRSPRYELKTPTGGMLVAFVSNEAERVEGFHKEDDIDGPLLQIVNEAKTVSEEIFTGLDRHTVNARLYLSSTGLMMGRFYECFNKNKTQWRCFHVGLKDCPHIPQSKIDFYLTTYGEKHPIYRSTIHGEFMEQGDGTVLCLTTGDLVRCHQSPPRHMSGWKYLFCDFAEGRAENAACLRNGNKYTIEDAWKEVNEDAVVGRFIQLFMRLGFEPKDAPEHIGGDAAGKGILDKLSLAGWNLHRQNFGVPKNWPSSPGGQLYTGWGAMAWIEGSNKIKNREVIVPDDDDTLFAQITTRPKEYTVSGKMAVMDKVTMAKELGLPSPDRGDVLFGAMAAVDLSALYGKETFDVSGWRERHDEAGNSEFLASVGADVGL